MVDLCAGCGCPIADRFLVTVTDRTWHLSCVTCAECQCHLTDKCFYRDGRLFCKADFFKIFGTKCSGCNQGITPNDLIRKVKGKLYHIKCFVCTVCMKQPTTGEELYVLSDTRFVCKDDFTIQKFCDSGGNASECESGNLGKFNKRHVEDLFIDISDRESSIECDLASGSSGDNGSIGQMASPRSFLDEPTLNTPDGSCCQIRSCNSDKEGSATDEANGTKRRGPRTTIKTKQLDTLKKAFAASQKPTRHVRELLAHETGLNMRVIQVWFQNRRSKERRLKHTSSAGSRRYSFSRSGRSIKTPAVEDRRETLPSFGLCYPEGEVNSNYQSYHRHFNSQQQQRQQLLGTLTDFLTPPEASIGNSCIGDSEALSLMLPFSENKHSTRDSHGSGVIGIQDSRQPIVSW